MGSAEREAGEGGGHKVGHAPAPAPNYRVDLGRALPDGLARALAAGDAKGAKVALAALAGLVDDGAEGGAAPVLDLADQRRKRGR